MATYRRVLVRCGVAVLCVASILAALYFAWLDHQHNLYVSLEVYVTGPTMTLWLASLDGTEQIGFRAPDDRIEGP